MILADLSWGANKKTQKCLENLKNLKFKKQITTVNLKKYSLAPKIFFANTTNWTEIGRAYDFFELADL